MTADLMRVTGARFSLARLDAMTFLAGLEPESVDLVVTDPAYSGMNDHLNLGHGRIIGKRSDPARDRWFEEFKDDPQSFLEFLRALDRVLRPDRHLYIMFDSFSLLSLGHLVRQVFDVKNLVVWNKVHFGMGHYFRRQHELILFASKGKRRLATRSSADLWSEPRSIRPAYPTQKPVGIFARMIKESAEPDMMVIDPFLGSGSSGVAALEAGCRFQGADTAVAAIELSARRLEAIEQGQRDPLAGKAPATKAKKAKAKAAKRGVGRRVKRTP